MTVLVACPTYMGKLYSLPRWAAAFHELHYQDRLAYMVDNTRESFSGNRQAFLEAIVSQGIAVTHIDPVVDFDLTFFECWKLILARAREERCEWVYSVEADNIVPPESLTKMLEIARVGGLSLVTMPYRPHGAAAEATGGSPDDLWYNELGCMLLTTDLLERSLGNWDTYANVAMSIFGTREHAQPPEGYARLSPKLFYVEHLDGFDVEFQNLLASRNGLLYRPGERDT